MKRAISATLCFVLAGSLTTSVIGSDWKPVCKRVLPSVVAIKIEMKTRTAYAAGFVVRPGYVLTCFHVYNAGKSFTVMTRDGKEYAAVLVSGSEKEDMALLRIDGLAAPSLPFASKAAEYSEEVIAIGCPNDMKWSVTRGIISHPKRDGILDHDGVLQTDAAINSGNSGGPLLNERGEVVGMVFAGRFDANGQGYALPLDRLKAFVDRATRAE